MTVALHDLLLIPTLVISGFRIGDMHEKGPYLAKSMISCIATKSAPEATSNLGKVNSSQGTGPPTNFCKVIMLPPNYGYWTVGPV